VPDRLTLEIPPDPAHVATARLFAASVARHFAVDEELIPDLKLAISEACAGDILAGSGSSGIHIAATAGEGRLGFEVTQPAQVEAPGPASESTPTPGETALLAMEVIQALFDDAEVVDGPDGRVVRFGAPTGSA
jgi:anti-sigma regulatory factor (Ser/Thr protein kinase)